MGKSLRAVFVKAAKRIAKESRSSLVSPVKEIKRIERSWNSRPDRATPSSAFKLVAAVCACAHECAGTGVQVKIPKQHARASMDDFIALRSSLDSTKAPNVGLKAVRDKMKNLSMMFGSVKDLTSYEDALAAAARRSRAFKRPIAYTVNARCAGGQIHFKDEENLYKLLLRSLGKDLVVPVMFKHHGEKRYLQPLLTPFELAELIGLKLALGSSARHQATDVKEVNKMEKYLRVMASCEQKRTKRILPTYGRDHGEYLGARRISGGKIIESVQPTHNRVKVAKVKETVVTAQQWVDGALIDHTITVEKTKIAAQAAFLPLPAPSPKSWDEYWVSPSSASMYADHTLPKVEGKFPMKFVGPHLVVIRDGQAVKPEGVKCMMHDNFLFGSHMRAIEAGIAPESSPAPTCDCVHVTKPMIRADHRCPKVRITNTYVDEEGEYSIESSFLARKDLVRVAQVPSSTGKTTSPKLVSYHEDVSMPIVVPEMKRFARLALQNTQVHAAHPVLRETLVLNKFKVPNKRDWKREPRRLRFASLEIYVPMTYAAYLFNTKLLPFGWQHMAVALQYGGYYPHLRALCQEMNGTHYRMQCVAVEDGAWLPYHDEIL